VGGQGNLSKSTVGHLIGRPNFGIGSLNILLLVVAHWPQHLITVDIVVVCSDILWQKNLFVHGKLA